MTKNPVTLQHGDRQA